MMEGRIKIVFLVSSLAKYFEQYFNKKNEKNAKPLKCPKGLVVISRLGKDLPLTGKLSSLGWISGVICSKT